MAGNVMMEWPRKVIVGSHNVKKRQELLELLRPHGIQVESLSDFPDVIAVVEDGHSFEENAQKKASGYAHQLKAWVLGEDSGLVVDALEGAPGIYSARFAGPDATDSQNNALLLDRLANVPLARRGAHYVCHVSLSDPDGVIRLDAEATCCGRIATQPAGHHGFGYDPLFEVIEYHRTFGELGPAVKSQISHRARALRMLANAWSKCFESVGR